MGSSGWQDSVRGGKFNVKSRSLQDDVKVGQSVSQSQTLGAVGSTGWATGPHLHFEFRVNGEYQDPSTIAQQGGGMPIAASSRRAFERLATATQAELSAAFSVVQASAD